MQVQVSGKHVDVGDALRSRIVEELTQQIGRFFERGGFAEVVLAKEGHLFRVDCLVTLASGQQVVGHAFASDAHDAFSGVLDKIEKRVRRYKRRLKNHHIPVKPETEAETAPLTILRSPDDDDADQDFVEDGSSQVNGAPAA